MPDKEIESQYEFYREVSVGDDGALKITLTSKTGAEIKPLNQRRFFDLIKLDDNGYLKVFT